jgi:TRAP transporter TAXI family solute receptor
MIRAALASLLLALPAAAQEVEANIVTGGASGTYIQIGRDLAALGAECGLALSVRESAGSIENMNAVRDRRATQLGIVQSDVLEYFQTFAGDDPALRRAAQGIRIAFPLYDEEVHVLARREIGSLGDLAGRRVATGVEGSGTRLTADLVLDLAEVDPAERVPLGPAEALEALLAGEIDALFYVVGAPAELLESDRIDPGRFHLLPLTEPVLRAVYTPAEIAAGTYGFAAEAVETVAVKAILVTCDYQPGQSAYHAASCRLVSDVSHLMVTRLERLRAEGHPKWRNVDMTALPPGWQVSGCVLDGVTPDYAFICERPDGTVVEEGTAATGDGANRLFLQRVCAQVGC